MSRSISDYAEAEFVSFMSAIVAVDSTVYPTERAHIKGILEFKHLTQHPLGSDLLYYPARHGLDGSLEEVLKVVKQWRSEQGLPGFKDA